MNTEPLADALNSAVDSAPEAAAPEPTLQDTIREAVEAQKARAAPDDADDAPKPPKAVPTAGDRPRSPDGKFAPAATDRPAPDRTASAAPAAVEPVAAQPAEPTGEAVEAIRPPPGWSPASKVAFDTLPEHVKADVVKREREVNQGLAKLAEFKPVEKYAEMARNGGTTLEKALENYTGMETLLRRDVFAGMEQILRNVGVNPRSFAMAYLQRAGGAQPAPGVPAPEARQPAIDPQAIVSQATEAVRREYAAREINGEIERFAADPKNRFFSNVEPQLVKLLQGGLVNGVTYLERLQNAYDMACQLDPEIRRLINQPPAPDPRIAAATQARAQGRATVGAPSPGVRAARPGGSPKATIEDEIKAAVAAQRGARA